MRVRAGLVAVAIAVVLSGCAGPVEGLAGGGTSAPPTPSAQPIEQVIELDPGVDALLVDAAELTAATDGWAPADARAALDAAVQALTRSVEVARLSTAGGPAASEAAPPVTATSIASETVAVLTAVAAVREGVVATAIQVVNEGAPDADQTLRDAVYTAVVAHQADISAGAPASASTPRALIDLVGAARATQDSQLAHDEEQARRAAEEEAAPSQGVDASGDVGSDGMRHIPITNYYPDCMIHIDHVDPFTGEPFTVSVPVPNCPE
jgi:hypothetical protein